MITFQRKPIFSSPLARTFLRNAWQNVKERFSFASDAVCLSPDHLHCIWTLPEGDYNYSVRWKEIKRLFTHSYQEQIGPGEARSRSREKRGEADIWQRRF